MKKSLMLCLIIAVLLFAFAGCGGSKPNPDLPPLSHLVIGVDDTLKPLSFRDEQGMLTGFNVDLANAVGEQLGIKIIFQPVEKDALQTELANGRIDCIWVGLTTSAAEEAGLTFSKAYLSDPDISGGEEWVIGFREEDVALRNTVEDGLKAVVKSGRAQEFSQDWFERNVVIFK